MRRSDRYKKLKKAGFNDDEIKDNFNTKVPMTLFSWNGEIDTLLSPRDSIWYNKFFIHSGMMSMDPRTGFVKSYVGGINYKYFKYDHVVVGKRQVGSTFKPFLYSLAVQEGFSPCYKVSNIPVVFDKKNIFIVTDSPKIKRVAKDNNFNVIVVHYCSNDIYQGKHINKVDGKNVYFHGRYIVEDLFDQFDPQFNSANKLVFSGHSAGALALGFNADLISGIWCKTPKE